MSVLLVNGDALKIPLADESVHCCVTSPPYYSLRNYQVDGQLGLEPSLDEYIENMVMVFREVWRVLRDDGQLWLNLGDSYAGSGGAGGDYNEGGPRAGQPRYEGTVSKSKRIEERGSGRWGGGNAPASGNLKPKDLMGVPWRVAFALQADGWYLRSDCIWNKPNPMPESVTDRPTKSHEYLFLLSKSARYFYDADAIREQSTEKNWRSRYERAEAGQKSYPSDKINGIRARKPAGWDTGKGSHGTIHRDGRAQEIEYSEIDGNTRNRRTVWTIATAPYSGSHFATFPPALVEPCIKAGTSERGVCPECAAPWERVVDVTERGSFEHRNYADHVNKPNQRGGGYIADKKRTTGWQPTCDHDAEPVPAIILDPFAGSGTTLLVARQLGRHGVGLDLSYPYLHDQARERLQLTALEEWTHGKKDGASVDDLPLFATQEPQT